MENLKELRQRLENDRPNPWEELPDLSLYMDQVLAYMPRQLMELGEMENLTSAMVNNYIKDGLVPRASGKKYSQVHLAYLTAVCALKQVISVKDSHELIRSGVLLGQNLEAEEKGTDPNDQVAGVKRVYEYFCQQLNESLSSVAENIPEEYPQEELSRLALQLALRGYANQLACRYVLEMMVPKEEEPKKEKKKK